MGRRASAASCRSRGANVDEKRRLRTNVSTVDSRAFVGYPPGMSLPLHRPAPKALKRDQVSAAEWDDWRWQLRHRLTRARGSRGVRRAHRRGAARRGAGARAVSRRHHALLRVADGSRRAPTARCACRSSRSARRSGWRAASTSIRSARTGCRRRRRSCIAIPTACSCWRSIAARSTAATATGGGSSGRTTASSACSELEEALDYIRRTPQIRDVLISGGDPLTLSTDKLEWIVSSVRAVEHVDIVRIGTRVPVALPMRIDDELVSMLKKYHPLYINTHFNHPKEVTDGGDRGVQQAGGRGHSARQPDGAVARDQLGRGDHRAAESAIAYACG